MNNSMMECNGPNCVDDNLLDVYVTWGGILIIKMLIMSLLTAFQRFRKGAYENSEDIAVGGSNAIVKKDDNVERVRRAHLNDLENCLPFLIASGFYTFSNPHPTVASWLIRVAVVSRLLHTIVYACYPIRQPARTICFLICLLITLFMTIFSIVVRFHM